MAPVNEVVGVAKSTQSASSTAGALLRPRADSLVEEITDGEAVLIDLGTTSAYTLAGSALEVWMTIRTGCHLEEAVEAVARKYSGDYHHIRGGVTDLIDRLLGEGLVQWVESPGSASGTELLAEPESGRSVKPFETPVLKKFEGLAGDLSIMQGYALRLG